MNHKNPFTRFLLITLALVLAGMACNLTADAPPTLAPRVPQSTLTPEGVVGPQSTIQPPPITNEPLPSGVITTLPDTASVTQQLNLVDGARMVGTVQQLVSFQNRHAFSAPAADRGAYAARDWIVREFEALQAAYPQTLIQVFTQSFEFQYGGETRRSENIMMVMNGTDGTAGVVMIGAHYDTVSSVVTQADNYQPGANDNGSGVAAVMEIARIMAQKPRRATVIFALFGAEEMGRYGSIAMAQQFIRDQRISLRATINLDMVGSPTGISGTRYDFQMRVYSDLPNTSGSRHLARLIELVARVYVPDMTVNVMNDLDRSGRWGDHQSFSDLGYPAVRLIEQEDDPRYGHNTNDTVDRIDPNYLRRTTQVALAALLVLADGPNSPQLRYTQSSNRLEWTAIPTAVSYVVALRRPGSLRYDLELTVQGATSMTWESFVNYEGVAVAAVDANGQLGAFSEELIISPVPPVE